MTYVVGVDGCLVGWVGIKLELPADAGQVAGRITPKLYLSLEDVWNLHRDAKSIWIDIPIGLPANTPRRADESARRMLSPARMSSVFPIPMRAVIEQADVLSYPEASELNFAACGKRLSKQTWAIAPKIFEADHLLRNDADARSVVVESHPEIVFAALNGAPMRYPKRTEDGFQERCVVLRPFTPDLEIVTQTFHRQHRGKCERDDILDALALAVGASFDTWNALPDEAEFDAHGLPMRIAYPVLSSGE